MDTLSHQKVSRISSRGIERLKLGNTIQDRFGERSVAISVVIPTFNKNDRLYNKALFNVLTECAKLVDVGVVDEVLIAEGSNLVDGMPDFKFIEFILASAMKYCKIFRSEVAFLQSLPESKQNALQGRYDFSFRILNQKDPLLHKIFLDQKILTEKEVEFLKVGKGANLWFSVPVTYGDIVCFVDSDVLTFETSYLKGLCEPILDSWVKSTGKEDIPRKVFTKAIYTRQHKLKKGFKIGGRLSRLAGIPLFKILSERDIFVGLDELSYPFSGECAFVRKALNEIQFSNGYDIETSFLCQLWQKYGVKRMTQVDFGFFRHIPGPEEHANNMLLEITKALFYWIRLYGLWDKVGDIDEFLKDYAKLARSSLRVYSEIAAEHPKRLKYTEQEEIEDLSRIKRYTDIICNGIEMSENYKPKLLKPWAEIKEKMDSTKGNSYPELKSTLSERVNKFTSDVILNKVHVHIDRTNEIIYEFID